MATQIPDNLRPSDLAVTKEFVADKKNFCRVSGKMYQAGTDCVILRWALGNDPWAVATKEYWEDWELNSPEMRLLEYRQLIESQEEEEGLVRVPVTRVPVLQVPDGPAIAGQLRMAQYRRRPDGERHRGEHWDVFYGEEVVFFVGGEKEAARVADFLNSEGFLRVLTIIGEGGTDD